MFGIKIIAETPVFRKCNKNFACQGTFKTIKKKISYDYFCVLTCHQRGKGPLTCKIFITFSESWCFSDNFGNKHSWKRCILYELH